MSEQHSKYENGLSDALDNALENYLKIELDLIVERPYINSEVELMDMRYEKRVLCWWVWWLSR